MGLSKTDTSLFPLIPLPIKEAVLTAKAFAKIEDKAFPLIPLPIKEAVKMSQAEDMLQRLVSINSTSYKGSGSFRRK